MDNARTIGSNEEKGINESEDFCRCSCGKSKNQPFCDGSHLQTILSPQHNDLEKKSGYLLVYSQKFNK
ncbi:MAG: CDGSH iron-sulfur domain-containing protein [Bacteroidales bacterium]|nr:CDGSH iron-sulfur domain-containing protein [Bacteroidales bacterium]MCF8402890.1 CDGSH iron-sulfur domain-containing protein [Bacteroidales bacterium]